MDREKTPLLSVIMYVDGEKCVQNGAFFSALAQPCTDREFVVVDSGARGAARRAAQVLEQAGASVRAVSLAWGSRFAAFNAGVAPARGRYLLFVDAGEQWEPEAYTVQLAQTIEWEATDLVLLGTEDRACRTVLYRKAFLQEQALCFEEQYACGAPLLLAEKARCVAQTVLALPIDLLCASHAADITPQEQYAVCESLWAFASSRGGDAQKITACVSFYLAYVETHSKKEKVYERWAEASLREDHLRQLSAAASSGQLALSAAEQEQLSALCHDPKAYYLSQRRQHSKRRLFGGFLVKIR